MQFEVRAVSLSEGAVKLTFDAASRDEAQRHAEARGYAVVGVRRRAARLALRLRAGGRFPLVLFSQELLGLLRAGINLVESLETLTEKEQNAEYRAVLEAVNASLQEGKAFSAALEQHPRAFPALFVASVRAAEKTGNLDEALTRYVAYRGQMDGVRKKVVSASIYPLILIVVGTLVTVFLMAYVVPRFSSIYADMGSNLPLASRLLLQWGQLLEQHAAAVGGGALAVLVAAAYASTRPRVRAALVQRMWQMPAIGARMKIYQLARFYRTLGMLLRGGTPLVRAIAMAADLLHGALRDQLMSARAAISDGGALSAAFERHGLTTAVTLRMLRVGERSGAMAEMMERSAEFLEEEIARWIEWFTKLFEPLLMALIGVLIGVIVVLMYLPIFELAGGIK